MISSILPIGSVRRVSKVPLSFSPAVASIAGYIDPIRIAVIIRNGMIPPKILPIELSLLD